MNQFCGLSDAAKEYRNTFRQILDRMIRRMSGTELTDSISRDFIVQMIPHHQAAIEMSYNILKYTTCVSVEEIAKRIIREQTNSVESMERVVPCCSEQVNRETDVRAYQQRVGRILPEMFAGMQNACVSNDITADFLRQMIPHHRGAVEMSENALSYDICPELRPIAEAILTSQKRGICRMQRLLRRMGYQA